MNVGATSCASGGTSLHTYQTVNWIGVCGPKKGLTAGNEKES